eukprot:TRINITY_DN25354_c0_g1_i1.p1 TRINITY_DN25354_c0_g1~~TRINITY_DN25354_c0_g1_i1.p1  ORF type:complete len:102 (+),score=8.22 TRINITY_DN25354_c0_g1_i1:254-559(+)
MKIEVRSRGTPVKKPCEGGSNLLLVGRFLLGAGGHTKSGFILCSSDVGVWHPSSRASGEALTFVFIGEVTSNSSMNSKPMVFPKKKKQTLEFSYQMVADVK